jgi:threonine-phosphate decarboxylase
VRQASQSSPVGFRALKSRRPVRYPTAPKVPLHDNFATNLNPLGPPPWVENRMRSSAEDLAQYPPLWHLSEEGALAEWIGLAADQVVITAGSTSGIFALVNSLQSRRPVVVLGPTFWAYRQAVELADRDVVLISRPTADLAKPWSEEEIAQAISQTRPAALFLCSPNNPTGNLVAGDVIGALCDRFPETKIVVDQTYLPFRSDWTEMRLPSPGSHANLVGLISLSKFYCLPGLRLGLAAFGDAEEAWRFRNRLGPLRISSLGARLVSDLVNDVEYRDRTWATIVEAGIDLVSCVSDVGVALTPLPTAAPFRLFRIDKPDMDADMLANRLLKEARMRITSCSVYGLDRHIRIMAGLPKDNRRLSLALRAIIDN